MNQHRLVFYGNQTLREVAREVTQIDQSIQDIIEDMFTLMRKEKGIGLAAPQIDLSKRIVVLDLQSYKGPRLALINPVITALSEEETVIEEGCLSVPGIMKDIYRPAEISLRAMTPEQKEITFDADGLLARVLQHEIDHLNGILFIDHLEDYIRRELTGELKKIKKLNKAS